MRLPVLFVGAALLLAGAYRLLTTDSTADAGAGVLVGAGLVVLGAWVWAELHDRRPPDDNRR